MSRFNRFQNLEQQRPDGEAPERAPGDLGRFEDDAPRPAPAAEASPFTPRDEPHTRFDAQAPVQVDDDSLARLPFRRCAACQLDSSKFDSSCIHCGASLTTEEALTLNRTLVHAQLTSKAEEARAARAVQVQQALATADAMLRQDRDRHRGFSVGSARTKVLGGLSLVLFIAAVFLPAGRATGLAMSLATLSFLGIFPGVLPWLLTRRSRRRYW